MQYYITQKVLGVSPNASQEQIKQAYKRLSMKYHPDRVHGEEAKKRATQKFTEIAAAFEILSGDNASGASHPSFAHPTHSASPPSTYQAGFDPFASFGSFGFGDHFSDPFELFRQQFGDIMQNDLSSMGGASFPPFTMGSGSTMYAPTFGVGSLPTQATSTSYTNSTSYGHGAGTSSRMISTTTTNINGKVVTRREEIVVKPDGTTTKTVTFAGDNTDEIKQMIENNHPQWTQRTPDGGDIVDLTDDNAVVVDLTNDECNETLDDRNVGESTTSKVNPDAVVRQSKRKFSDICRCLACCFPIPKKRRKIDPV